ncbi:lyase family protein [Leifsonia sp. A12D58]|uniref:lyase family protein n=1 Tax=Leifsonia sp. A12D58 TaxID=3397674 RepID=UPI0039E1C93F
MPELEYSDLGLLDPLSHDTRARELTGDKAWLRAMADVELALSRALIATELAPDWMSAVCDELATGVWLDDATAQAIAAGGRSGGNPVIPLVKRMSSAAEAVRPGASDFIHVGATSQDILDSAAMVIAGEVLAEILVRLRSLAWELSALADAHRGSVMAGRTLGQQASPTTFGFVAAGWLDAVLTVYERAAALRATLPAQLGGAVGNLAVLTEAAASDRVVESVVVRFARGLGLAVPRISWHTNRLVVAELAALLAQITGVVGTIALDVTVLSRTEIGEVTERLGVGEGGSSAMPHKRNPVTAVLIVSAARQTPGLLATVHGSLLSEDQRPAGAWHAEWQPLRDLEGHALAATTAAASLAGRLDVDLERMAANLEVTDGLIYSERVTAILTDALGKSAAFAMVEKASAESVTTRRPLRVVLSGLLVAHGSHEDLRARVWSACEPGGSSDQSAAAIDKVLARHLRVISPSSDDAPADSPALHDETLHDEGSTAP